jgi:hypothetical protein
VLANLDRDDSEASYAEQFAHLAKKLGRVCPKCSNPLVYDRFDPPAKDQQVSRVHFHCRQNNHSVEIEISEDELRASFQEDDD